MESAMIPDLHADDLYLEDFSAYCKKYDWMRDHWRLPTDYRMIPEMPHNLEVLLIKCRGDTNKVEFYKLHKDSHKSAWVAGAELTKNIGFSNYRIRRSIDIFCKREEFFDMVCSSSDWFKELFLWNII